MSGYHIKGARWRAMKLLGSELTGDERKKIIVEYIEPSKTNETIERIERRDDGKIVFYTSLLKEVK